MLMLVPPVLSVAVAHVHAFHIFQRLRQIADALFLQLLA